MPSALVLADRLLAPGNATVPRCRLMRSKGRYLPRGKAFLPGDASYRNGGS